MITDLTAKICTPCEDGISALTFEEAQRFLQQASGWALTEDGTKLIKTFKFGNLKEALHFSYKVGQLAEAEGHHPSVRSGWGYCIIELKTEKIRGLHENDFIMAAKINALAD
jgi:Pterin-4a-carbinolamine dehydratase